MIQGCLGLWPRFYAGAHFQGDGVGVLGSRKEYHLVENLLEVHWWHWCAFSVLIVVLLILDLVVFHRR